MTLAEQISQSSLILTEGAISERLRRMSGVNLHPELFNTPLIYDAVAEPRMREIYRQYREIAITSRLPQLLCAPTWRLNNERLQAAEYDSSLIYDAVGYMKKLQHQWHNDSSPLYIAGLLGPKNDCYSGSEALSAEDSQTFHLWQIEILKKAGVDCIIAQTIPAISEALGIARAAIDSNVDILLSFVIDKQANVLDNTTIAEAIDFVDNRTSGRVLGYMVNCVYPTFLNAADQPQDLFKRLIGIQANSSSKSHDELDGSKVLHQDDLDHWGRNMILLNQEYGVKILGGCCGTDQTHLNYLATRLKH